MDLRAVGLALCVAACGDNQVAPDAPARDALADAAPFVTTVHGTIVQLATENGSDGQPVGVSGPPDPAATHLSARLDDGSTQTVLLSTEGAFDIGLYAVGQAYRLTVAVDGQPLKDFASSAPTLALALFGAGRSPRAPVTSEVVVKAVFDNWVDGDTAILDSTGLWTSTAAQFVTAPLAGNTEPWAFQWTWSTVHELSGPPGLIDAAAHDALQVTAWRPHTSPAYTSMIGALVHTDVTMVPGHETRFGADNAPIQIPALPPRCLHVVAPRATELARVASALPDTYAGSQDAWELAVPAGDGIGPTAALLVASGSETGAGSDADLIASFGNPFGGAALLLSTSARWFRDVHATAGDNPRRLAVGTQTWAVVAAPADCAARPATATVAPSVAIPSVASLNGGALDHDFQTELAADGEVSITWTDAAPGVADDYVALLVEVADVNGQTTLTTIDGVFTTAHAASFDGRLFVAGHSYLIEIVAQQGVPNAGNGDFRTLAYPFADATSVSHLITARPSTL